MDTRENVKVSALLRGGCSIVACKTEFSQNTKCLLCGCGDVVKVYSVKTGGCIHILNGHRGRVTGVKLNPTNPLQALSSSVDKTIIKWDYTDGILVRRYRMKLPVVAMYTTGLEEGTILAILQVSETEHNLVKFELPSQKAVDVIETQKVLAAVSPQERCNAVSAKREFCASVNEQNLTVCRLFKDKTVSHQFKEKVNLVKTKLKMFLTCVACHPLEECVATGVNNGRIVLWYNVFSSNKVVKTINHWHSLEVCSLCFTQEGSYLLSGGHEKVLVKWQMATHEKDFLPRLGMPLLGITCSQDNTSYAVSHFNNSIQVVSSNFRLMQSYQGLVQGHLGVTVHWPMTAGLSLDPRTKAVVTNGNPGHLQFYDIQQDRHLFSLDIVGQNYISSESLSQPLTQTNIECVAFDGTGDWLATVERWDNSEITPQMSLKFWSYMPDKQSYMLNTLVEMPHKEAVLSLKFRPGSSPDMEGVEAMLVSTSTDGFFKMWTLVDDADIYRANQRWDCDSVGYYRQQAPGCMDFSRDGTILAVGFGGTLTLWDPDSCGLRVTFSLGAEPIRHLMFSQGLKDNYLVIASDKCVYVWDVLTNAVLWCSSMEVAILVGAPNTQMFAVISQDCSLSVFDTQSSGPIYKHKQISKSPIMAALFVPVHDKPQESCDQLLWQQGAQLYFINEKQEFLTLGTQDQSTITSKDTMVLAQGVPPTPVSVLLASQHRKTGHITSNTQRHLVRKDSSQSGHSFLNEMLSTPAHVMPPVQTLCSSFLETLLISNPAGPKKQNELEQEDEEEDMEEEHKSSDSSSGDSESDMETIRQPVQKNLPETHTEVSQTVYKEEDYNHIRSKMFRWLCPSESH